MSLRLRNSLLFSLLLCAATSARAQHTRIYAVALANDSAGAFMGGSSNGSGLYQSDDTGATWRHLGWQNVKSYSMDRVSSASGATLYQSTGTGLLRSTDEGEHWKLLTDWRVAEAMDVAIDPANRNTIILATAHGAWVSFDRGDSWDPTAFVSYCSRVAFNSDNLVVYLESDSGVYECRNAREALLRGSWKKLQMRPKLKSLQTVGSSDWTPYFARNDARNMISCKLDIGNIRMFGTLGKGVWTFRTASERLATFDSLRIPLSHTLPTLQIWRIKSFLVTP